MSSVQDGSEPDLSIVAQEGDALAEAVKNAAAARGKHAALVSFREFARSLTVDFSGSHAQVRPSSPVLLRTTWESTGDDPDAVFLQLEAHAQAWAACLLSDAPVINRPSDIGMTGLADHLTSISMMRARAAGRPVDLAQEIFSSDWTETEGDWIVQDLATFHTAVVPSRPRGDGPYRYRPWRPTGDYVTVTIVDEDGWAADRRGRNRDGSPIDRSLEIIHALGLRFGAVTWGVSDEATEVARVEAYPSSWAMGPHLKRVADALLRALLS